ncbi:hypothetical protein ACVJGD_007735 [Bradyrhizobium sp. USDA 10063]
MKLRPGCFSWCPEWKRREHNGLALDWPQYSKGRYHEAQREAEGAGQGLWNGSYVDPWAVSCMHPRGKLSACSDDANAHP